MSSDHKINTAIFMYKSHKAAFMILLSLSLLLISGCISASEDADTGKVDINEDDNGVDNMSKNALVVIAQQGFQHMEYEGTKSELQKAKIEVVTASANAEECTAENGSRVLPDVSIDEADITDYDAIVLIGGPGAMSLANIPALTKLIVEAKEQDKTIAAICIAPVILARAGVLEGKNATVWDNPSDHSTSRELIERGAEYTGDPVTVDGNVVTGNGPAAAHEFGKALADVINNN